MHLKILLYIPNIIGYLRILLLILAYTLQKTSYTLFFTSYFLSFALDALDGIAARALNQCSKYGAVLDMLTDRMATLLITFICIQLPNSPLSNLLIFVIILDLVSHWLQTLVAAKGGVHHKSMKSYFKLLDFYYGNKFFMCCLCVGYEMFFLVYVFMFSFGDFSGLTVFVMVLSGFLGGVKSFINVQQLVSNALVLVDEDIKDIKARNK